MSTTDTITDQTDAVDEVADDAAEPTTPKARPDYTAKVLDAPPESDPPKRRGAGEGSARTANGPKGIAKHLAPIVADTDMWSVEGQADVWVQVAEYTTATGAKGAIKNIEEHPEKLPVHDGAELWVSVGWEFKDTRHYVDDPSAETAGEGAEGDPAQKRISRLSARYWVSADEYLRVTAKGENGPTVSGDGDGGEAETDEAEVADPDDGVDEQGFPV